MENEVIEVEIYDDGAAGQDSSGVWPTKKILVVKSWFDEYARNCVGYQSSEELLKNYTFDEVNGLEIAAKRSNAIR